MAECEGEYIEQYNSVLSHASNEGFRYYLPAYMCWSLKNIAVFSACSVDKPIYSLTPHKNREMLAWSKQRYRILNSPQRLAIIDYLEYMSQDHLDCDWAVAQEGLAFWTGFHKERIIEEKQNQKKQRKFKGNHRRS